MRFVGMLQAISRLSPVRFISDHFGQPQCSQNVTNPGHAPANGSRYFCGAQFFTFTQYIHNRKRYWIAQDSAEA